MNKILIIIIPLILFSINGFSQKDTIEIIINEKEYFDFAKTKFSTWYSNENDTAFILRTEYDCFNCYKYNVSKINFINFPVYIINKNGLNYKCSDNFANNIDFTGNLDLQFVKVFDISNSIICYENVIITDYFKHQKQHLYKQFEYFVCINSIQVNKYINKFIEKNQDCFIFTIMDLEGYWAIKKGKFYFLKPSLFQKIRLTNGNREIRKYGEEFIRDIAAGHGTYTGKHYKSSHCCIFKQDKNNIYIKVLKR